MSEICENCTKGSKLSGTPKGVWIPMDESNAPLDAYFSSATGDNTDSQRTYAKKALIISPDIFGLGLDNPKLIADIYADKLEGVDVWVADTFKGHPPVKPEELESYMPDHAGQKMSITAGLRKTWAFVGNGPKLFSYRGSVSDTWLVDLVAHLRKHYGYERVGMMGYCWGGGHVTRLAAIPGVLDVALPVHPSAGYAPAVPNAKVPIGYFLAEEDDQWDEQAGAALQAERRANPDKPKVLIKKYPGTAHGFGCRPNLAIPQVKESWEAYIRDSVAFLNENL